MDDSAKITELLERDQTYKELVDGIADVTTAQSKYIRYFLE